MDFGKENGGMLAPEIDEKSMSFARSDFLKKCGFSPARIKKLRVQGFEVGGKNRSKIDEKMKSKREGVLGSIFHGFWWVWEAKLGGQTEPGGRQNAT